MTKRQGIAVIVAAKKLSHNGEETTTYYGPFLPHVGSATTSFVEELERELTESDRYKHHEISVEDVFIGEGESDCRVQATR
jgi:hypothetical protein